MSLSSEFDIWSSADGSITARKSTKAIVDDSDAPYGFDKHEVRVTSDSAKLALSKYYKLTMA